MKCNLFIPGFAKCGTSSLHQYLALHPHMSSVKEPHYFAFPERIAAGPAAHDALFSHAKPQHRVFGEASTLYCVWEPALQAIASHCPNARAIVLLRDPFERLVSHYRWMHAIGLEDQILKKALQREQDETPSPSNHRKGCYPWYMRQSSYREFCAKMSQYFPPDNLLLIRSEELAEDRLRIMNVAFSFLNLEPMTDLPEIRTNETTNQGTPISPLVNRLARLAPRRLVNALDPKNTIRGSARRILFRKRVAPTPDESTVHYLKQQLASESEFFQSIPKFIP
jgi:hypothetical protein